MPFAVIIPARMSSTRLPGKPLLDIAGKPMVVRSAEQAAAAGPSLLAVACDHPDIAKACERHGIRALLTRDDHPTGTDRLAEAATMLGLPDDAIVVNVQGDEPLVPPAVIRAVAARLEANPDCAMATAAHPVRDIESFCNPNVVKVELDGAGHALTFTRAPVPWPRDAFRHDRGVFPEGHQALHHIGLYAYRAGFLRRFPGLERAPIETAESLEQLRALWHGFRITVMVLNDDLPAGVDTEEDLERVRRMWPLAAAKP